MTTIKFMYWFALIVSPLLFWGVILAFIGIMLGYVQHWFTLIVCLVLGVLFFMEKCHTQKILE